MEPPKHISVLAADVLELLNPARGERYLDLTAGYGGHARNVLGRIDDIGKATLVDRDQEAVEHLSQMFSSDKRVTIVQQDFLTASQELLAIGEHYDVILADLGISSPHIDNPDRGFSIARDGPLDMRMDVRQPLVAADLVNNSSVDELSRILREYGEQRGASTLARQIVAHRPYGSTAELAALVARVLPYRKGKTHPATQVFQALRISVNDEIRQVKESLPIWIQLLKPRGRLGVISFHSLEDRLVKQAFTDHGGNRYDATLQLVTKKPVTASAHEVVFNPRARSAKLRVAQRK